MIRRKVKAEDEKSIPETADGMARTAVLGLIRNGKLTAKGRQLAKLLERELPPEKVDEWGWNLSRKERAAIKKRAAEKKAAEEKKKAEARARAAYLRRFKNLEIDGEADGFAKMKWAFRETVGELKRRGFSIRRMNALRRAVEARLSEWDRLCHKGYVEYFVYDYYRECGKLYVELFPEEKKAQARKRWARALEPFKRPKPRFCHIGACSSTSSSRGSETMARHKAKAVAERKAGSTTDANAAPDAWKKIPLDKVPTEEPGKHNTFFEIAEAYRAQLKKFKKGGCDLALVNPLIKEVQEKTCTWIRRIHPEYVQYFAYQFCEWCRDAMIDNTSNARAKEFLAGMWKKILSPRVYPPWECPFNSPMPRWPRGRR